MCVRPSWNGRRQAHNPFTPKLVAADQALLRWPPRSPDHTPCNFFLWGYLEDATASTTGSAWAARTNHRCQLMNRSWYAAVPMGGNGLSAWYRPCDKQRTHRALKRYGKIKKRTFGKFVFPSVGRMLQSFPPFNYTDFMKFVKRIMNNPVYRDLVHTAQVKVGTSIRKTNWRILCVRVFVRLTLSTQINCVGKIQNF